MKILFYIILLLNISQAKDLDIQKIFDSYDINGTLVISSLNSSEIYTYNDIRVNQRFSCASTFKIPHTLIILSENLIHNKDDVIKWDGIIRDYTIWNKNQTLETAIKVSCVWCYKSFSHQISKEKYISYLEKFNYGNKNLEDKSSFWLNGDLKISANEQIEFLKKFYDYQLPIDRKYIDITKDIITIEKNSNFEIKAKSGWDGRVGWYIGYVKTNNNVYFFAMNGDFNKNKLLYREKIVKEALKIKNII